MALQTNRSKGGERRCAGNRYLVVSVLLAPFVVLTILGVLFATRSNGSSRVPADNLASDSSLASSVPTNAKLMNTPAPSGEPRPIVEPKLTPKPVATSAPQAKPTQPPVHPTSSPVQTTSAPAITTQKTTSVPVITIPSVRNPTTTTVGPTASFAPPPVLVSNKVQTSSPITPPGVITMQPTTSSPIDPLAISTQPTTASPIDPLAITTQPTTSSPIDPLAITTQPTTSPIDLQDTSKQPTSVAATNNIPPTSSPVSSLATNVMPSVFNFLSLRPTGTATRSPTKAPVPQSNFNPAQSFRLKMYWEPHYFWQEEERETWWCIACTECTELNFGAQGENCRLVDWCQAGDQVWLQPCKEKDINNGEAFSFVDLGDYSQIKVSGTDLCLQRTLTRYVTVERCDNPRFVRARQLWYGMRDDGLPFEIRPGEESRDAEPFCLTQQHHPKNYEIVALKECQWAHYYDTGLWIQYPLDN